jgi:ABC-type multidrug transport system fused ATPase/permease subunit
VFFIIVVISAGSIKVGLLYCTTRLSHSIGTEISIDIYNRTLHQDYLTHINRNSSEVVTGIIVKTNLVIGGVVVPILNLMSSSILAIGILTILISINPIIVLFVFPSFAFLYFLIVLFIRRKVKRNSEIISSQATLMVQHLQEGLGAIRDIIMDSSQNFYLARYSHSVVSKQRASAENTFDAHSPKPILEVVAIVFKDPFRCWGH